ncbi:MAG: hypothetical protein PWQ91_931 [Eubacteriales bacterium]|nr:hypothetical protein [Eubacteriales bacterium]MDN5363870.1 hypothetical protein [Eubacteriales bacterium]
MLSGHNPGRKGSVTPLKAKVMIRVIRGILANPHHRLPSRDGMPPGFMGRRMSQISWHAALFFI